MTINDSQYINIQAWMITKLNLKGNELLIYALIHGFSQDGNSLFHGSLQYLMKWTGLSKQTVITILDSLETKKYLVKILLRSRGAVHYYGYYTSASRIVTYESKNLTRKTDNTTGQKTLPVDNDGSKNFTRTGQKTLPVTGQKTLPNNLGKFKDDTATSQNKEAAETLTSKINQLFKGSNPFDAGFIPDLTVLVTENGFDNKTIIQFLEYVFERTKQKKPSSFTNLFYTLAKSKNMYMDFKTAHPVRKSEYKTCPICGQQISLSEMQCTHCGYDFFECDEQYINIQKQIYSMPKETKDKFKNELQTYFNNQNVFGKHYIRNEIERDKFKNGLIQLYEKYGIVS